METRKTIRGREISDMNTVFSFMCLVGLLFAQQSEAHEAHADTPETWLQQPEAHANTPETWLLLHNAVRAKVGAEPLTWNTTLEDYAKNYSQVRSGDCALIHSMGPYGENIYWGEGDGAVDAAGAMKCWVDDEIDHYDHHSNLCLHGVDCRHYTQIVWKDTKQVGCGMAKCAKCENKVFITCSYCPQGNWRGQRPY